MCRKENDELLGMSLGYCSVTAGVWYMEGDSGDGVTLLSCTGDIGGVMSLQYYSQASRHDNSALEKEFASL